MNKTRMILVSLGAATFFVVLTLGYLVWDAASADEEQTEDLDVALHDAQRLSSLQVYPCRESVAETKENRARYDDWCEEARIVATSGDRAFDKTTPPAFKAMLVEDVKRLAAQPGTVDGLLVRPDFSFGLREYVSQGMLPSMANLPRLQREWGDVLTVVGLMVDAKVSEITELELSRSIAETQAANNAEAEKKAKKPKKNRKGKAKAASPLKDPAITIINTTFKCSGESLVKLLNLVATDPRFIVTEDLSFSREKDEIVEKLGGDQQKLKQGKKKTTRRVSKKNTGKSGLDPELEKLTGTVFDPQNAAPLIVKARFKVYDFRTLDTVPATDDTEAAPRAEEAE